MGRLSTKSKKLVMVVLGAMFFLDLATLICLSYYYMEYRPSAPDVTIGKVVPYNVHGAVFYLSQTEANQLHYLEWGMIVIFSMIGMFVALSQSSKSR